MTIQDTALLLRNPLDGQIDLQQTLQSFAKEVIAIKDQEKRIKNNRRYKAAIRRIFKTFKRPGPVPMQMLIPLAMESMKVKPENWGRIHNEMKSHIIFNRSGYLRIVAGKAGGVELIKP